MDTMVVTQILNQHRVDDLMVGSLDGDVFIDIHLVIASADI